MAISRINYKVSGSRTGDSVWRASDSSRRTNIFNQLEIINPSPRKGENGRYSPVVNTLVNTLVETVTPSPQEPYKIDQTVDW